MFWNLLVASFFIGSACAMHMEYLRVDSAEELLDGSLDSTDEDEDLAMSETQLLPGACWACQWAMKKVKKQLGNNPTVDIIKAQLKKVCNSIGFLRGLCKKMINKYLDTLVEELSTTDDPTTICGNLGICKSLSMLELFQAFPQHHKQI
ncbi:NK-lysin type 1 precursor [Ictalurus punctatus]|uniref:NK-lysin type 1 n=1 Tax=Ictalurus punctatus TaxID=7998 RepID=Q2VQN9_ICTPU|nr:NK-lysin type 1 precursor [Ictalurus punctatus]AAY16122.1 NK-lysin type 1 [Ictalurus punctatus]AAY16123.1 NK-lysin type 1 [Ictalurus punctatus]